MRKAGKVVMIAVLLIGFSHSLHAQKDQSVKEIKIRKVKSAKKPLPDTSAKTPLIPYTPLGITVGCIQSYKTTDKSVFIELGYSKMFSTTACVSSCFEFNTADKVVGINTSVEKLLFRLPPITSVKSFMGGLGIGIGLQAGLDEQQNRIIGYLRPMAGISCFPLFDASYAYNIFPKGEGIMNCKWLVRLVIRI